MGRKKKTENRLDVDLIRQVAANRWLEILTNVAGLSTEVLDGKHHPCPKCGGKDRFRMVDESAGAVLCNQCFKTKNGDGFAATQWAKGIKFPDAAKEIADYLGLDAIGSRAVTKKKPPPDQHLDFKPWNDALIALWARHKPPIIAEAVKAAGGRLARYRDQYTVLAFPIWGQKLDQAKPVGWAILNTTGKALPKFSPEGTVEWVTKPKLTYGSSSGVIGDIDRLKGAQVVWKLEGITDVLAWLSMPDLPSDHAALTNSSGSQERPAKWICGLFTNRLAYVLHDADKPGQDGALGWEEQGRRRPGWAGSIAAMAKECFNIVLPYPIAEVRGKDFRDWLADVDRLQGVVSGTFGSLRKLAEAAKIIAPEEGDVNEAVDDPWRLARANLDKYAARHNNRTIRYWSDSWWIWKNGCYHAIREGELQAKLTASIKEEFDRLNLTEIEEWKEKRDAGQLGEGEMAPPLARKVTPQLVGSVLNTTRAMVCLSGQLKFDTWIPTKEQRSLIAMENGILDLEALIADQDDFMQPHSADWFSMVRLPYGFDCEAECPQWEAFLMKNLEGDQERIAVLQEWAGYLLLPDTGEQRFMVLEGEGANGKSVFCAALEAMLGKNNCSHVSLELFGDRFSKTQTLGKLVNICGDVGELDKVAEGVIKAFSAGNTLMFDVKGHAGIHAVPTARLMIACNNRPRFTDRSEGIWRRVLIIPWQVVIQTHERIRNMDTPEWWTATGELPGVFRWAVVGLHRLRTQGGFSQSELMDKSLTEYRLETNPARQFFVDHMEAVDPNKSRAIVIKYLYKAYRKWATEGGFYPLSATQFGKEIRRAFPHIKKVRRGPRSCRKWSLIGIDFQEDVMADEDLQEAYIDDF